MFCLLTYLLSCRCRRRYGAYTSLHVSQYLRSKLLDGSRQIWSALLSKCDLTSLSRCSCLSCVTPSLTEHQVDISYGCFFCRAVYVVMR